MSVEVIRTKNDLIIEKTPFFSVKEEDVKFRLALKDYPEKTVKGSVLHMESGSKSALMELAVENDFVNIGIKNLDGMLQPGRYFFEVLLAGGKKKQLPFIMAEELDVNDEKWLVEFALYAKNKNGDLVEKEVDVKVQLINLDKKSVILNQDVTIRTSNELGIEIARVERENLEGRYEFRAVKDGQVIIRKHYIMK